MALLGGERGGGEGGLMVRRLMDLSYNGIGSEGGAAIAKTLEVNSVLNKLDVRNNELGPEDESALQTAVQGRQGFELLLYLSGVEGATFGHPTDKVRYGGWGALHAFEGVSAMHAPCRGIEGMERAP